MKTILLHFISRFFVIMSLVLISKDAYSTHAQSADITYTCVGGNTYNVRLAFYRDCAGVAAPNTVSINVASVSCGQNFNVNMNRIPNTGIDVTPICPTMTSQCAGGNYPGVQEWVYQGNITLPAQCIDWVLSFNLCCRNNAISTINNPGGDNIYVEARINNLMFTCNNSPQFSNRPVPFICVSQNYCFNHGAIDSDGDSLVYQLIPPMTGPNTSVNYFPGYSAAQPLMSVPATTINSATGDICMTPTMLEVGVMAVRVSEYRNGEFVGSVIRDIQVRVIPCTNSNPSITGINGGNNFSASVCAGQTLNFNILSSDPDAAQNLSLSWNNAIAGASFTTNIAQHPTGTFSWTPNSTMISSIPYCFTVTVTDDNCPLLGSQTYSFCITVTGFNITASSTPANCGAANGTASVTVNGGNAPYSYSWSSGNNTASVNGLQAGNYTVNVSDATGCIMSANTLVAQGAAPGNIQLSAQNVSCFGGNDGAATVNANGGQQPYTYQWSNGGTSATITGLTTGLYSVSVTTANGCTTNGTINVPQPSAPLSLNITSTSVLCNGQNNGSATVNVNGGTGPYNYAWNTNPQQSTATANGLIAGQYTINIMDAEGCTQSGIAIVAQPAAISIQTTSTTPVSCNGGANGSATVLANGGNGTISYQWNNGTTGTTINSVAAGNYTVTASDMSGCQQTHSVTINQPLPLSATIVSQNDITCFGANNGSIQTTVNGGTAPYNYQWNINPPQNSASINNLAPGNYFMNVLDAQGCTTSLTTTISQPAPLTLTVSPGDTICPGTITTISATANGGSGGYVYHWNNNLSNATSHNISPAASTTYSVYASDANACTTTAQTIFVHVNDINLLQLGVTATPDLCIGQTGLVFTEMGTATGIYIITWNNNLPNGPGPFSITPTTSGYYTATITDGCGNQRVESTWVEVHPNPDVQLSPQLTNACGSAPLTFFNDMPNENGSSFAWNFGDGNTSTLEVVTHPYTVSGVYNVSLIVTSPWGCVGTDQTQVGVTVRLQSEADFEISDLDLSIFHPEARFTNTSTNATFASWMFGDGNGSTVYSPMHTYANTGTYEVTLISNNNQNCPDTITKFIQVSPEFTFYIPNAFTPDGDGKNDVFYGKGENIAEYDLMIFNRWGEMVFNTQNINTAWDGTYRGSEEPKADVYVYKVKIKDSVRGEYHFYDGHVAIVK
ncbi:MAG TPA: PKD domain-containing protein [Flavobacteriales bacterium]|nr:hypothetical protein [Flavobacteriales bacterium]HRE95854.1 PKD domain-containing protein [Flavobacteriales bacterium]HRJ34633.1 PKD domain-containing protein [Flavobacteriales bacterium]HRJ37621.1 PKD domain-containing protein [Flavobacteriales bacterium]